MTTHDRTRLIVPLANTPQEINPAGLFLRKVLRKAQGNHHLFQKALCYNHSKSNAVADFQTGDGDLQIRRRKG